MKCKTKIADSIVQLIGNTPLVRLNSLGKDLKSDLIVKLEQFNPMSSIKDRICCAMIEDAEKNNILKKDMTIIEPTSGNTGIALAYICSAKKYKLILTTPDTINRERRRLLSVFGAKIILTPGKYGMRAAIEKAYELNKKDPNSIILEQFINKANPDIHRKTTALEIWEDTDGKVDIVVIGVGTAGTITGTSEILKQLKPSIKTIAVEPAGSPLLSGGKPGFHKIHGLGAGVIPEILNKNVIDEIITVKNEEAKLMMYKLAKEEGIFSGISSGAILFSAHKVALRKENIGKMIVAILPDTGERYLSTWIFSDEESM